MEKVLAPEIFEGKSPEFIQGFKFFPKGEILYNGKRYGNGNYYPWEDLSLLERFQAQYETQLSAAAAAYAEGVNSI